MTYRPSEITSRLGESVSTGTLVAGVRAGTSVTVTSENNSCTFTLSSNGLPITTIPITVPPGTYRDALMAVFAVNTAGLPIRFTSVSGRVAVELLAGSYFTLTYTGNTSWMGFTEGQSTLGSVAPPSSSFAALADRVATLESKGGAGGAGSVALGGPGCVYASPTSTVVSGTLGWASGTAGYAAVSPLFIDQELTFSKMMFEIWTVFTTAATYTCVLFDSSGGYPATLLRKVAISTGTTGGIKSEVIEPITLTPGTYWIGAGISEAEGAGGALVCNTGVGIMQAYSATGNGKSGSQRIAAGWKSNRYAVGDVGSSWPGRTATGMDSDYRVPRVGIWAG